MGQHCRHQDAKRTQRRDQCCGCERVGSEIGRFSQYHCLNPVRDALSCQSLPSIYDVLRRFATALLQRVLVGGTHLSACPPTKVVLRGTSILHCLRVPPMVSTVSTSIFGFRHRASFTNVQRCWQASPRTFRGGGCVPALRSSRSRPHLRAVPWLQPGAVLSSSPRSSLR